MTDPSPASILVIDNDLEFLRSTQLIFKLAGIEPVDTINDSRKIMDHLAILSPKIILLDLNTPHPSGLELLPEIHKDYPHISILILSSKQELETAVRCMKLGAKDYLVKPVEREVLIQRVLQLLATHNLQNNPRHDSEQPLSEQLEQEEIFAHIITHHPKMRLIFQHLKSIACSNEPVLITGETGTGKELIAQALHHLKVPREPLVIENVAGLDDTVFTDTLFGHVKGAFTGAETKRTGLVAKADNGTLVLDEIGDLSPASQIKLLRLLQEKTYTPLGSDTPRETQARILVTTHCNLQEAVAQGMFRNDLYYRLAIHKVHLPPLRKRREDIPELLNHFISEAKRKMKKNIPPPPEHLTKLLANHQFPGNIRELRAMTLDAARHYNGRGPLPLEPFLQAVREPCKEEPMKSTTAFKLSHALQIEIVPDIPLPSLKAGLKQVEIRLIEEAMNRAEGNQTRAATFLGLSRQAFYKRFRANKNQ